MPLEVPRADRASLSRYLLGQLSGAEEDAIEDRFAADDAYFALYEEVERDLIRDYAAGVLELGVAELFERNYLITSERCQRVLLVRALIALDAERGQAAAPEGKRLRKLGLNFALTLPLVLIAVFIGRHWLQSGRPVSVAERPRLPTKLGAKKETASASAPQPTYPSRQEESFALPGSSQPKLRPLSPRDARRRVGLAKARQNTSAQAAEPAQESPSSPKSHPPFSPSSAQEARERAVGHLPVVGQNNPVPSSAAAALANARRVEIEPFDYSSVVDSVTRVFGNQQDVGHGIKAMLTTRVAEAGKIIVVDRGNPETVMGEQYIAGNRVRKAWGAQAGRISGVDAILTGDIVIFGSDDKQKGLNSRGGLARACTQCGDAAAGNGGNEAVVMIDYRLIDAKTSQVIATGEVRGESKRSGLKLQDSGGNGTGGRAGSIDMTSSNFGETIIGEATQDCVSKLAAILATQIAGIKENQRDVDARVVDVAGGTLIISAGARDGIGPGDVFDILRIDREVKDPVTRQVLDLVTTKVGEMTVTDVRDRIATGRYVGSPVLRGFAARKRATSEAP